MFCSCMISTDKRVTQSLCNSRASCFLYSIINCLCDPDNSEVSSTSTTNTNCSPRWIVYPPIYTSRGQLNETVTTVWKCLKDCANNVSCITVEWHVNDWKCVLHHTNTTTRAYSADITRFDIVRKCAEGTQLCCHIKFYNLGYRLFVQNGQGPES